MAKYSYEFKLKVVEEYLTGKGGYTYLAERNEISNKCILQNCVKAYQEFGNEGLGTMKIAKHPLEHKIPITRCRIEKNRRT